MNIPKHVPGTERPGQKQSLLAIVASPLARSSPTTVDLTQLEPQLVWRARSGKTFLPPLLQVSSKGKILWGNSQALRLLRMYWGWAHTSSQLPTALRRMLRHRSHKREPSPTQVRKEELTVGKDGASHLVRLIKDNGRLWFLLDERSFPLDDKPVETPMCTHGLTKREAEVLQWLAAGKSNKDIGKILTISHRTVEKHLERIFQHLGVETRTAAAAEFYLLSQQSPRSPSRVAQTCILLCLGLALSLTAPNIVAAQPGKGEEKATPAAQEQTPDDSKSVSPVGVAPDSQKEALPQYMLRTLFDLPGVGVLTPKGTLIVEPYLSFAHLSNNRVTLTGFSIVPALTIGLINITGVSRDIYTAALVGRYGLTNRLELELRIPYLFRADTITQRPLATPSSGDTVSTATGSGLGDIEATARYQINKGGSDDPYFVGFTRFKSTTGTGPFAVPIDPITGFQTELPTGSGFYILQPGLTVLLPSDPAVLFGSMSFIWNMPRDVGGQIGRVDPGNGANANIGLGLSLNEKLSLTLGYDHTVFQRPTANSNVLLTTTPQVIQIGTLLVGGAYRLSDRSFINFLVGVGATREAPDLQVTIRIPIAVFSGQ